MTNNNENPIQFPFIIGKDQIRSFKRNIPVSVYDFYIIDEIKDVDNYVELIQTLKSADPQDTVFIYLNTVGGDLYTTVQILSAMNTTHAKVITCLEGQVCSAGTFIFLKGDTKIVNPHCTFMIHSYSQSSRGKGNEIVEHINYMKEYFNRLAADIYQGFLSEEEIKKIIAGHDMWLHSHDVVDRLEANGHDYVYTGETLDLSLDVDTKLETTKEKKKPVKKVTTKRTASKKNI